MRKAYRLQESLGINYKAQVRVLSTKKTTDSIQANQGKCYSNSQSTREVQYIMFKRG